MLFKIVTVYRCLGVLVLIFALNAAAAQLPDTVGFPSRDGNTQLVGYLFKPQGAGPFPAVVMLHGRAGPYSTRAKGVYAAHTLTQRHQAWGEFWAERGYLALHVDSFGPRGYAQGFPIHSYQDRPAEVSEQTVRPLDAYGALEYLRGRGDVIADRVGVQGWSNGAMTLLASLADTAPGIAQPTPQSGFRAALALYPGCRVQEKQNYRPYAPLLMLLASEDKEVSPVVCQRLAQQTLARGAELEVVVYAGAQHSFDDPGSRKQANDANRAAMSDARIRAERFFAQHLLK
ncbi:MAG: dienelactone hydrolase family protein [Betaproteobacteria bacterium]|nr:dienelactone hydrolase family protein [Betaproteobacteria bacterium]MBI3057117.1 dienelactone hydrolase family protein [Betaproteobacteria bacterium]